MRQTKLKKGDEVVVLVGRSKGATGKIDRFENNFSKLYVSGVNIYKKHVKPSGKDSEGGIIDKPMSIHISNVALIDPKTKKPTRLGYKLSKEGSKTRIAKSSGSAV
jgi:large subunit ribosomal protein L24